MTAGHSETTLPQACGLAAGCGAVVAVMVAALAAAESSALTNLGAREH
jgi:hypothetical protein